MLTIVPRAGLLGSLAAIALVLISFLPLLEILGHPLPGMLALVIVFLVMAVLFESFLYPFVITLQRMQGRLRADDSRSEEEREDEQDEEVEVHQPQGTAPVDQRNHEQDRHRDPDVRRIEDVAELALPAPRHRPQDLVAGPLLQQRSVKAKKPFFCWMSTTRMHVWTRLKKEAQGRTGIGLYPDGMVEHDDHVALCVANPDLAGSTGASVLGAANHPDRTLPAVQRVTLSQVGRRIGRRVVDHDDVIEDVAR